MLSRKQCAKTCYVDGFAYSVASVICLACDKIVMGLGTSMMIHDMWITVSGNARELRKQADDLDILMESNRKIYMNRAKNLTEEELIVMMEKETILTPDQCLEYGFCDEIADNSTKAIDLMQSQRVVINQMKKDLLLQKSLKDEMLEFMQSANKNNKIKQKEEPIIDPKPESKEPEQKVNNFGSFFNAISKIK